jgi:ankyrin repeat protein
MAEIHQAVEDADPVKVEALAKADPSNLELPDALGNRPLHLAGQNDQVAVAKVLLELGADVNARGDMQRTPMHFAALNGGKDVAEMLAMKGADLGLIDAHGFTPLYYAVQGGGDGSGIEKVLLNLGAPVDLNSAVWLLDASQLRKKLESDPHGISNAPNPTQLVGDAIIKGDADSVTTLIDFGASINGAPSFRPLVLALPWPHLVRLLLERGADVAVSNSDGKSLLTQAKELNATEEVLKLLQEHGAKS